MMPKHTKIINQLDWRDAPGITEKGKQGTNSMLAERDYSKGCGKTYRIDVVHGVHIWFCTTHHQPHFECRRAIIQEDTIEYLESIIDADRTPDYEYGEKNSSGKTPEQYQKWLTPREIAEAFIKKLQRRY